MKGYKYVKHTKELKEDAIKGKWEVDTEEYDQGSDNIWITDVKERFLKIRVNVISGAFLVLNPSSNTIPIATHESDNFYDKDWYIEILDLLYVRE